MITNDERRQIEARAIVMVMRAAGLTEVRVPMRQLADDPDRGELLVFDRVDPVDERVFRLRMPMEVIDGEEVPLGPLALMGGGA